MSKQIFEFSESLSGNQSPKILPTSERLRLEIVKILKEKGDSNIPLLQNILNNVLSKYDVTGFAIYSEIRDMETEGILSIDNGDLNNNSIISSNSYLKKIPQNDNSSKDHLLYSFDILERKIRNQIGVCPMISLHCDYDFYPSNSGFYENEIEIYFISYKSLEAEEFINKFVFQKVYIPNIPNNFKFILGNYGVEVKSLNL